MIHGYNEYIDRYLHPNGLDGMTEPGEHHFVSVYLLPKLYAINQLIPDYVNPDGTKSILGDIVYYKNKKHYIGLEVKLGTIRLTANEFNNWIRNPDSSKHPEIFVGIGTKGIVIQSWIRFRANYLELIGSPSLSDITEVLKGKYGPQRRVNALIEKLQSDPCANGEECFLWTADPETARINEATFEERLKIFIDAYA